MKKALYTALALFFLSACIGNADDGDSQAIKIAYLPITHSVAVMMMAELDYGDSPHRIELVPFTTWPDVVDALRTGRVDGASILFEVALQAKNEDTGGLKMLSLSHRDGNVVVVDNSITSYHDLIGKIVAIPHRLSPQHTLLQKVLEREGISPNDIQIIEISPAEMPFSMASGAIAAYIVAEPFGSIAENAGVGWIIETSDQIYPYSVCCVMVFRQDILNEEIREWLQASFSRAAQAAHKRDDLVIDTFMRRTNLSRAVVGYSLRNTHFENLQLSEQEYQNITDIILQYGILERIPDFYDFVLTKGAE